MHSVNHRLLQHWLLQRFLMRTCLKNELSIYLVPVAQPPACIVASLLLMLFNTLEWQTGIACTTNPRTTTGPIGIKHTIWDQFVKAHMFPSLLQCVQGVKLVSDTGNANGCDRYMQIVFQCTEL